MNKYLPLCFSILAFTVRGDELPELLASHFAGLPISEQKSENLPAGRESEVLAALEKRRYDDVLLRINHAPTVERILGKFIELDGKSAFTRRLIASSASPYVIDELAPQLYKSDTVKMRTFGEHADSDLGESAVAAEIIGQSIFKAPEFSPEVKEWAKMHLGEPGRDIIQAGRAWWELNQAALLANQFAKVQVPACYPAGLMPEEPAQQLASPPAVIDPTPEPPSSPPEPTPEPIKASVAASIPAPATEPASANKTNPEAGLGTSHFCAPSASPSASVDGSTERGACEFAKSFSVDRAFWIRLPRYGSEPAIEVAFAFPSYEQAKASGAPDSYKYAVGKTQMTVFRKDPGGKWVGGRVGVDSALFAVLISTIVKSEVFSLPAEWSIDSQQYIGTAVLDSDEIVAQRYDGGVRTVTRFLGQSAATDFLCEQLRQLLHGRLELEGPNCGN